MSIRLALTFATLVWPTAPRDSTVQRIVVAPAETVAVTIAGAGDPVVIIPGLLGSTFGFRKVIAALEHEGVQLLVVDPLGTGASSRPSNADYSLSAQATRVEAVCDSLGIRGAIVVAHTLGASIAYRMAAHRADLVAGIVSINGAASEEAGTPGLRFALRFAPLIKLFGGKGMMRGKIKDGLRNSAGDPSWVTEDVIDEYAAHYRENVGRALSTMRAIASSHEAYALEPLLRIIAAPVVLMVGAGSPKGAIKPDETTLLLSHLPRLRIDSVAGAGQYIQEEQPDRVAAAVLALRMELVLEGRDSRSPESQAGPAISRSGPSIAWTGQGAVPLRRRRRLVGRSHSDGGGEA